LKHGLILRISDDTTQTIGSFGNNPCNSEIIQQSLPFYRFPSADFRLMLELINDVYNNRIELIHQFEVSVARLAVENSSVHMENP